MSRKSIYLYVNPSELEPISNFVCNPPVRTDNWYSSPTHLNTIAIHLSNFVGQVIIEATLKVSPSETDWFPILLNGSPYLQCPAPGFIPTEYAAGQSGALVFNFPGRFVYMRAQVVRGPFRCGFVDRILLNI